MVLTRAAAARLAASEGDKSVTDEMVHLVPTASTVQIKGRQQKKAGTQSSTHAKAAVLVEDKPGQNLVVQNEVDPVEEELQRFHAEVEEAACSKQGCKDDEAGRAQSSECLRLVEVQAHGETQSRRAGTRARVAKTGKLTASATSQQKPSHAGDAQKSQTVCIDKASIAAEPLLYNRRSDTEVLEAASFSEDAALPSSEKRPKVEDGAVPGSLPLVPTTRLALSRAERAARAKILKEALVNVDEKQRKWQQFAKGKEQPAPVEGQENAAVAAAANGEQASAGAGWVFGKKVAFSFKPKSASPAKKGSRGLSSCPSKQPPSVESPQEAASSLGVAVGGVAQVSDQAAETPIAQAVPQTPLPNPRPTLALNTPAIVAQARSGNPVLDLRFLFPKATSPEPSTPPPASSSCAPLITISLEKEGAGGSIMFASGPPEAEASGRLAISSEALGVCTTPAPNTGGFASPFSVESASPALKEILRAARSFVVERTATGSSPSPLNPNANPNPKPNPKLKGRRESYSDVFASPTLVNIFKGARTTVAQKENVVGTEEVQTELERITAAAKEYASSRAQLAVAGSPLGVLCQKETELALSFAEKLQLADVTSAGPTPNGNVDGSCDSNNAGSKEGASNEAWEHLLPAENGGQAVRFFDGRTVQVRSVVSASQALPPVPDGSKTRAGTLYVVVDTNCYLSTSDMPAVRRICEAAQSVAGGQRRYEWVGAEGVVIVVPNAVIRELDGLKLNPNTTNMARAAMRFLKDGCKAQPRSIELAGPEKTVQVEPIKNGPPEFSGADDAILGCCLHMDKYEGEGVLLTNDVALQLKAMMYGLEATSASEFLSQRLRRLEQPANNWAAQMRQVVAMRESRGGKGYGEAAECSARWLGLPL